MATTKSPKTALQVLAAGIVFLGAFLLLRSTTANSSLRRLSATPARNAVLVELFTSEGCSSCPPADALLSRLRQDLGHQGLNVIPLGFHVDYWNSLGWKDRFSSAEFSRRQEQYARALGTDGPYTPQMIVDGRIEFVGSDQARAHSAISEAATHAQTAQIEISTLADKFNELEVHVKAVISAKGADVMLAVTEDNLATKVGAGENGGRELRHAAVVRDFRRLGTTDGGNFTADVPLKLATEWKRNDLQLVVFVQESPAGKVLGAASVPLHFQQR
ncbi:MAG TPA: DUF1223 domain-containing protein [Candidatus Angelobacter sp.]|nr:DUF1223 domain-containing protein [Candidatus Angelobacter sp.]